MPRKPKDPFGLSLLDILSNALGGTLLLLVIVAQTMNKHNENVKSVQVTSGGNNGSNIRPEIIQKPIVGEPENVIIQLGVWEDGANRYEFVQPSSHNNPLCQVYQGLGRKSQWAVIRDFKAKGGCSIRMKIGSAPPDSISYRIIMDSRHVCESTRIFPNSNRSDLELVSMISRPGTAPIIFFLNKPCTLDETS